ncbi:transglycosylase family protein [Nocardioides aequoreus]|uniref:transglycosylase family protein n=1 Tax=Nocardioides aequoreus TaxID=397278 RepID=UPI0009FFB16D|nr:transglycosylase family protein [Nocardioides aequoreus]
MRKLVVSLLAALALVLGLLAPLSLTGSAQAAPPPAAAKKSGGYKPVVFKMKRPQKKQKKVPHAGVWNRLAKCESGGNWRINTGNGYYGGLQISPGTWGAFGGKRFAHLPHKASKGQQITVGVRIKNGQGWGAWPSCSRKIGVR